MIAYRLTTWAISFKILAASDLEMHSFQYILPSTPLEYLEYMSRAR